MPFSRKIRESSTDNKVEMGEERGEKGKTIDFIEWKEIVFSMFQREPTSPSW